MIALEFGDNALLLRDIGFPRRTLNLKVRIQRAMNGTFYATKQTPASTIHEQAFALLSVDDLDKLVAFVKACWGGLIKYTDRDDVVWFVKILTEPTDIEDQARSRRVVTLRMVDNG